MRSGDEVGSDWLKLVDLDYEGEYWHYLWVFGETDEAGPALLIRDDGPDGEYQAGAVGLSAEQAVFLGHWLINKYS